MHTFAHLRSTRLLSALLPCAISLCAATSHAQDIFRTGSAWRTSWPTMGTIRPGQQPLGRVDLDSDINYDGVITNDGTDNGGLEASPPGQIIGKNQMSKFVIRITPFTQPRPGSKDNAEINFDKLVGVMELNVINLVSRNGSFASDEEEKAKSGHLRVWSDDKRSHLLLDSRDPMKRRIDWDLNAPQAPAFVYVECVEPSAATSIFAVVLHIDDTSRKDYAAKKMNPLAGKDWVLVSCKSESPPIKQAATDPNAPGRAPGFGNYATFSKADKDFEKIWVKTSANP